jgi:hypothetical protein
MKARVEIGGVERVFNIKLYREGGGNKLFERELYAHSLMQYCRVKECIPEVYWKASWPVWRWDPSTKRDDKETQIIFHGIVRQFFEQTCNFHWDDLRLPTAEALVQGLSNIHAARVCCNLSSRHVLLVREASEGSREVCDRNGISQSEQSN